jgi:signal transduction histidine kinase
MSESLIDAVFRTVDSGLCLLSQDGVVLRANESWLESMQLTAAAVGRPLGLTAPERMATIASLLDTAATVELPPRPRAAGGVWREQLTPVHLQDTRALLISMVVGALDQSEQSERARAEEERGAESAVARSRAELLALIEKLPLGVFVSDGGAILYANPTFAAYCGRAGSELIGRRLSELAAVGASQAPREGQEWAVLGASGRNVTLECSAAREIEFEGKLAQLWTCRDPSPLKAIQAQVIQSDRLASVGMLAAGVAHEINNPLAYVIGALDVIEETLERVTPTLANDEHTQALESVHDARHGALRVKAIVRALKSFSRPDRVERVELDLVRLLDAAISIVSHEIKQRARLVRDFGDAPRVAGSEARLGQVFVNLLVNAAHAIPEGRTAENEICVVLRKDERGHALIEVHDTGSGFSAQIAERIFEPFFTTKSGLGTGLGLAISRNTVTAFGGRLWLESQLGVGTVARVSLPPAAAPSDAARLRASTAPAYSRKARVLVIDDEAAICKMFWRLLKREHEVVTETSAQAAWLRLERGEQFDVIFCDVTMPGMNGMELYQRMFEAAHDHIARLVFISGGTFTKTAHDFLEKISNRCLDKPIAASQIRSIVSQMTA